MIYRRTGDIFRTKAQTITIPVNLVGVMGAGLAKAAVKAFPDLFGIYFELLERKLLTMGRPCIVPRRDSKWILLFPTKFHWRSRSNLEDIVEGVKYLSETYKMMGIRSIAIPALGCGLGGLDWKEVRSAITPYLQQMDIPVYLYNPR